MAHNSAYVNRPQFQANSAFNDDITPDVPTFNSNAMDNDNLVPLNNCANGCCSHTEKAHTEESEHKCCCHGNHSHDHKHKGCNCDHK